MSYLPQHKHEQSNGASQTFATSTPRLQFIHTLMTIALLAVSLALPSTVAARKKRRPPAGGRVAVVVDERLAALRDAPDVSAGLLQRLSRGRAVALTGARNARGGLTFYRVAVTSRTSGWLQAEAVVSPSRAGDDERLLRLARGSEDYDRLARLRIFLDTFPRSALRPAALLLYGQTAEEAAVKLTREAQRRLDAGEMSAGGASLKSYYMNYVGLDRYNRIGVKFVFDGETKQFHYDGEAWREIIRRYPRSPEAERAKRAGAGETR